MVLSPWKLSWEPSNQLCPRMVKYKSNQTKSFLEIVYLYSEVWGFSIFSFCTPPVYVYRQLLLTLSVYRSIDSLTYSTLTKFFFKGIFGKYICPIKKWVVCMSKKTQSCGWISLEGIVYLNRLTQGIDENSSSRSLLNRWVDTSYWRIALQAIWSETNATIKRGRGIFQNTLSLMKSYLANLWKSLKKWCWCCGSILSLFKFYPFLFRYYNEFETKENEI